MSQPDINQVITNLKNNCSSDAFVWIILLDNEVLKIKSKMTWHKIGHAKNALRNFLYYSKGVYEQLLETNRVVFTPIRLN